VLAPLQREVGERWHAGSMTVAEEHLVTQAARQRVVALLHSAPRRTRQHVVAACFPNDEHELGLMGAALRFRHAGWRVTFLGARTPAEHLARVVRVVTPQLVALSSVVDEGIDAFRAALTEAMHERPKGTLFVVGGRNGEKYRHVAEALGASLVSTAEEWAALLK
jgi:methanogenic corrinoid protein MtbC1